LHIFRHLAQKFLDIRQYAFGISVQSDEKSDSASAALSLCGIALSCGSCPMFGIRRFYTAENCSDLHDAPALQHTLSLTEAKHQKSF